MTARIHAPGGSAGAIIKDWLDGHVELHDFVGGTLAVGLEGRLAVHAFGKSSSQPRKAGRSTKEPRAAAVKPDTIFDIASLTKPVVTATLAAMLTESGQLDVDVPVAHYIPEWTEGAGAHPDWRAGVTVRNLLTHTSGLPAHRAYFRKLATKSAIVAAALAEPLECEPGTRSVYSDVGFIVLGEIIERLTGRALDRLADERIFEPLGMKDTFFRPKKAVLARVSPVTDELRQPEPLPRGEMNDENARAMGGVAAHAGLFSTAGDLAIFCQMMLNGGIYAHRRLLRRQTVARFTAASPLSGNARTMGWMVPTPRSSSGHFFSPRSFGHLGYTGTSMWIDPDKRLFVVLLTNRVNPSRDKILELRAELHDEVVEALGLTDDVSAAHDAERGVATKP